MDTHTHLPSPDEIRATRRNSTALGLTRPSTHEGHVVASPSRAGSFIASPKSVLASRRNSTFQIDEDLHKIKQLYAKISFVLTERAKLNPSLKNPRRLSFTEDDSTEMSNILKAESQFAPNVNFNGEYTMVDATNEEVDCAIMDAIDNYGHPSFLPEDEDILNLFLREVSNKLHGTNGKTFSRRRGTKLNSLVQIDAALLEGYTSLKSHFAAIHMTYEPLPRATSQPSMGKLNTPEANNIHSELIINIQKWSYDPFIRPDTELMDAAFHMISEFGLIEKFHIDTNKLRNLISLAKKNYRPNAFHNFYHAFGVMHLSYQILNRGAAEYLSPLDILAVLIGALCHDLDHPGNNNAFEISSGSELSNIYADDAVLERYHIYMTHKLLKISEADILSGLTASERTEFRGVITSGIMATDMSKHFSLTEKLVLCSKSSPPFLVQDPASRTALVGFIIHCADIGAQTQKQELALKWGSRVLEEFRLQAANEAKLGIPTAPFMQGLESELACMKLQQGFVAGIVIPLWTALADCLPKLRPCVDRAMLMKTHYEDRVSELSEKPLGSPRGAPTLSPRTA